MNVLLLYYTGTFNTRFLSHRIKAAMEEQGDTVTLYEIDPLRLERLSFEGYDLVGLGYPIYGFAAPWPFLKFIRYQRFPRGLRCFIYKNSGETYHDNDASSLFVMRKLRRSRVEIRNEYHFGMPYNIHFKFDDHFVREQLHMNDRLIHIMLHELRHRIPNMPERYALWPRFVTWSVARWQYIGGDVCSYGYYVKKDLCINCDKCIKNCPTHNIYRDERTGDIRFHHHCLMCMRCSLCCPKDAIYIGFLDRWGWRVNGQYNFKKIEELEYKPVITHDTKGFYECYVEYFDRINLRYSELFHHDGRPRLTADGRPITASSLPKVERRGMVQRLLHSALHHIDIRNYID